MITLDGLKVICPLSKTGRLALFVEPLSEAMREFEITTPARESAFIAQVAHESGGFRYVRELASGEEYDIGEKAKALGNTPEDDGDGERYKGRGLIQISGVYNYRACGDALGADFLSRPDLLEEPIYACRSAGWFWKKRGCNELADAGDFYRISKRINGGLNGIKDRIAYHERAKTVIT